MKPTRTEIAENFQLWCDYVDPSATMTEEEFDRLTLAEKLEIQRECFGEDEGETEARHMEEWDYYNGSYNAGEPI